MENLVGIRILVVDDNEMNLRLIRAMLERKGMKVTPVNSAEKAMLVMDDYQDFDMVLSDLDMPGISGLELFRWIKEYRPETQFILMTGRNKDDNRVIKFKTEGGGNYLKKPYKSYELIDLIGLTEKENKSGIK